MFRMYLDVDMSFVVFIIIKYKGSDKVRIPVLEVIILAVKDLSEEKHKLLDIYFQPSATCTNLLMRYQKYTKV